LQNVQNLLCFLDKSTFFKAAKFFFVKKEEKWAKSTIWASQIYTAVDRKEPFIDIF